MIKVKANTYWEPHTLIVSAIPERTLYPVIFKEFWISKIVFLKFGIINLKHALAEFYVCDSDK